MDWFWPLTKSQLQSRMQHLEEKMAMLGREVANVHNLLEERIAKLEKIERITANVARERAQRPKNWTQFRILAEGIEEPNARRQS